MDIRIRYMHTRREYPIVRYISHDVPICDTKKRIISHLSRGLLPRQSEFVGRVGADSLARLIVAPTGLRPNMAGARNGEIRTFRK